MVRFITALLIVVSLFALSPSSATSAQPASVPLAVSRVQAPRHVLLLLLENHDWADIQGNAAAPYINHTLLPRASYATQYYSPAGAPSLPNYLWLEAGSNLGVTWDATPADASQSTREHLVTLLTKHGLSWRAYEEGITAGRCPLNDQGEYAVRHDPFVYFNDVTGNQNPTSSTCTAHIRPLSQFSRDLRRDRLPRYSFITPDLCHDMHDSCPPLSDPVAQGDHWLAGFLPALLHSPVFSTSVLFITWDEPSNAGSPIGLIALGKCVKGHGYAAHAYYGHSSTLRTVEELLGVRPFLRRAADASDLRDLFSCFPT